MNSIIGQRIKERRKELKITQTQIQQQTSISSGNLSCIENGKYLPSAIALLELSDILNCSVDWILTGKSSISNNLCPEELNLIYGFRELPQEDKNELLAILQIKLQKNQDKRSSNSILSNNNNIAG